MMRDLVIKKPENVCDFIIDWIEKNGKEIENKRI